MRQYDFLIAGGGIIGLTICRTLLKRGLGSVCILEKEPGIGYHASGRNSGILHAGIYYSTDSLKAKVCWHGSRLMHAYALERKIPVKDTGKVIVCTHADNDIQIDVLYSRARANGVPVEVITKEQLRQIEPAAFTLTRALYSPKTSAIDSLAVLRTLEEELTGQGAHIVKNAKVHRVDIKSRKVYTSAKEEYSYGHFINAAGLQADQIAHIFGAGEKYRILPFKGIYRELTKEAARPFRGSIYPAPNLNMPFLGVHITRTADEKVIVGPTAIPALGRENYDILGGMDLRETPRILANLAVMYKRNEDGFRRMVWDEFSRYSHKGFLNAAKILAPALNGNSFKKTGKVGIRAQLVDIQTKKLVMDFVVEKGEGNSIHVLNAISPAFTASFALSEMIADKLLNVKNRELR